MTTWETLLTAALLGTERRIPQIPPDAPASLHQLEMRDAEHLLLSAAGVMAVYRRAGYMPHIDTRALPEPAREEALAPCSTRAVSRLIRLLTHPQKYRLLIGEWLMVVARKGKRIPHYFLPDVMQQAKRDNALLPLIIPVLGERGKWLAAQNSEWGKYLLNTFDEISSAWAHPLFSTEAADAEAARANEAHALESLNSDKPLSETSALDMLGECKHIWSGTLSEAFIAKVVADHEKKAPAAISDEQAALFAISIPRTSIEPVLYRLKGAEGDEKHVFFRPLIEILDLRRDMLQELSRE
jgi:hypothetical protein